MPSKGVSSNPCSAKLRPNGWSVLTRSPICGREEWSHLQICELGLGLGWGALPLDPQGRIELSCVFGGPQMVRPSWEEHLHSICERLWILKHLPLWKTPPEWVRLPSWLLYKWANQVRPGPIGAPLWTKWAENKVTFSLASLWPVDKNGLHSL